ncbi:WYL domain-containing protein [Paenibacillus sp. LMG 31458]|uniref:WYL domain-containing protein n=1 Tax=Paenibacillus phytorum TaxID=2654977 RepID=A0ABX1XTH0_9BACL|nr:YafY family protein [Paenibacillus phytorum]NOU71842.1 WYL domain-containing protein [Paenibacillus phytorum]
MLKSQRLIQLIMIINAKKSFTVPEIAKEFGLSTRTITRDLEELSALGVPIYSVQGRGGGYRLLRERMLPPIAFSESEAVAIFFACQSLKYFGSLPFDAGAAAVLHKFYHYLPTDVQAQIDRLRDKVAIWSPERAMSAPALQALMQAVMVRSAVTIAYQSGDRVTTRDIQPIGLYASHGFWYCPAYCFQREGYRLFRGDRILSASLNPSIAFLEEVDKRTVKDWNEPELRQMDHTGLAVRLTSVGSRTLETNGWFKDALERHPGGGASIRMQVPAEKLRFYADMIWELGAEAQIIEPAEAVDYIKRKVEKMRELYS